MSQRLAFICIVAVAIGTGSCFGLHMAPCSNVESYRVPDGRDYRGFVNVTVNGYTCQAWASQSPQSHTTPIDPSIGTSGVGNNYCRNPLGQTSPGCFTTTAQVRYEPCNVGPVCVVSNVAAVADVSISPTDARQNSPVLVALNTTTPGALIYYSVDGSDPVEVDGAAYTKPFYVFGNGPTIVKAFAVLDYWNPSRITLKQYSLALGPVAQVAIQPTPVAGSIYYRPVLVTLANTDPTASAVAIYYTTDGTMPDVTSTKYTGPFWIKDGCSVQAVAVASGRSPSAVSYAAYTILAPQAPAPLVVPVINDPTNLIYGAFSCVVTSDLVNPQFMVSINGTVPVTLAAAQAMLSSQPVLSNVIRVDTLGTTKLDIYVSDTSTKNSAAVTQLFTIVSIPSTTIVPPPGVYYGPTEIVAGFNVGGAINGLPLMMYVNSVSVPQNRIVLTTLGNFTVETFGKSMSAEGPHSVVSFSLQPQQLQPVAMKPNPLTDMPAGFAFASPLLVSLPPAQTYGVAYIVKVTSLTRGTTTTQRILASSAVTTVQLNAVAGTSTLPEYFSVTVTAVAADPSNAFLIPSSAVTLTFAVAPPADRKSPYFRVTPQNTAVTRDCTLLSQAITAALYLSPLPGGANVEVVGCGGRPAFRVVNLQPYAVAGYTRYIANDLASPATSIIYAALGGYANGTSGVAFVDTPYYEARCVGVPYGYFPQSQQALTTVSAPVTPAQCASTCAVDVTASGFLIAAGGAGCACINNTSLPLPSVESSGCTAVCANDPTRFCGGYLTGNYLMSTVYNFIVVSGGSKAALFSMSYSYTVATSGQLMTTSPFSVQLQAANLPTLGGNVKFVLPGQDCKSLAVEAAFDSTGLANGILLRRDGMYSLCVALSTDDGVDPAGVYRLVGRSDGQAVGGIVVSIGENIPVLINPASGTYTAPLTVTIATPTAGASLVVTVDQQLPLAVIANAYSTTLTTLGTHIISANAVVGASSIGLPASRVFTLVPAGSLTAAPQKSVSSSSASQIGIYGYQYLLTGARTATVVLLVNQSAWRGCSGVTSGFTADDCVLFLLAPGSTDCTYPTAQRPASQSPLQRSLAVDGFAFETVNAMDVTSFSMSRLPLTVCIAALPSAANKSSGLIVSPQAAPLTPASSGTGLCSASQARMCQRASSCSARLGVQVDVFNPALKQDQLVCVCNPPADYANLTVFCTSAENTPAELVGSQVWNGSIFTLPSSTPVPTSPAATQGPVQQGSYLTLFFLVVLFSGSTAVLIYYKRLPAPQEDKRGH